MEKIENLINLYKNNKLAHIYLIETNDQEKLLNDFEKLFKTILENNIDLLNNPNFILIKPDGKNIKKEQVLELRRKLFLKPNISKNNLFVIFESEKLSLSSSNSMLKILEEPTENSYGFLFTNNVENIILTIRSRAQIIKINYVKNDEEFKYLDIINDYVKLILNKKEEALLYNRKLRENLVNKEETVVFVKELFAVFNTFLNVSSVNLDDQIISWFSYLKKIDYNEIYRKTKVILEILNTLNYNVNIELILDRLVIELGEENE